ADVGRRVREHVAAPHATLRAHEPGALHRQQDLLEVGLGERGALRDLLHRRGAFVAAQREREQGAGRVVTPSRDLHRCHARAFGRPGSAEAGAGQESATGPPTLAGVDPVLPALDGASVAGVVPALFGRVDDAWIPEPARRADAVVLLVLDGLGWSAVQDHAAVMPNLARMQGTAITTVAPSTTATALTSIATGLAPAQHGIVGYRMLVDNHVLNVLRWTVAGRNRPPDPFDVQRHPPFLDREVPVVTRTEFRDTGFTQAHLRGGRLTGWHTVAGLVEQC